MKNFDTERDARYQADRTFRLGGEVLTYKASVAPEVILRWNKAVTGELGELSEENWLAIFDETVELILEGDESIETWRSLRRPEIANPLNIADMREVLVWLIEQATGRPTTEPQGSSAGSATTGPISTPASSSPGDGAPTDSQPDRQSPSPTTSSPRVLTPTP